MENLVNFCRIAIAVGGVFLIIQSFVLSTKNFKSALFFQIVPFVLGILCIFSSLVWWGRIVLTP
jgi:hypothetical protein